MNLHFIKKLISLPCSECHFLPQEQDKNCPMLDDQDNFFYKQQRLAIAKMNLRYFTFYINSIAGSDIDDYYANLREQFNNENTNEDADFVYNFLSEYLKNKDSQIKMIITTNYDFNLENKLLKYNQLFYNIESWQNGNLILKTNSNRNNSQVEKHPVIFKIFGTWDENFIIEEAHFEVLKEQVKIINTPKSKLDNETKNMITTIETSVGLTDINGTLFNQNHFLFLGYRQNDHDFKFIVNNFISKEQGCCDAFFISQFSQNELDEKLWQKQNIGGKIQFIDIGHEPDSMTNFITAIKKELEKYKNKTNIF